MLNVQFFNLAPTCLLPEVRLTDINPLNHVGRGGALYASPSLSQNYHEAPIPENS